MSEYRSKYLKYKSKYTELKNQLGGSNPYARNFAPINITPTPPAPMGTQPKILNLPRRNMPTTAQLKALKDEQALAAKEFVERDSQIKELEQYLANVPTVQYPYSNDTCEEPFV